jgi:glycerophosphoryl diester phosphodiesterase
LELKGDMTAKDVCGIVAVVEKCGWFGRTTFISFSSDHLLHLREGYPTASAQYIIEEWTEENVSFMIDNQIDADLRWDLVKSRRVKELHNAGLIVNCWTVDGALCAAVMAACGVDFITTNVLE